MKKFLFWFVSIIFSAVSLAGCGKNEGISADDGKIAIVCTTFPQYDWVSNLIQGNEENFSLTLLMDKGSDLHNFQPSALDIARVSDCSLFIYVGGESDLWVQDALKEAVNTDMRVINMMEVISGRLVMEEHAAGDNREFEEVHDGQEYDEEAHDEHEHEHEHGSDEHVWLSLRNAELIVENIAEELSRLDDAHAELYQKNCDNYVEQLKELDSRFAETVENGNIRTLLFADRFPFRYFVEDYGLNYYAAFEGCSAETEASFETVAFLAGKLDELDLGCVLVTDGADDRLAQVIIENSHEKHQQIYMFHSMQSVSEKDIREGLSYLSVMEENLEVLKKALNG